MTIPHTLTWGVGKVGAWSEYPADSCAWPTSGERPRICRQLMRGFSLGDTLPPGAFPAHMRVGGRPEKGQKRRGKRACTEILCKPFHVWSRLSDLN